MDFIWLSGTNTAAAAKSCVSEVRPQQALRVIGYTAFYVFVCWVREQIAAALET